MSDTPDAITTLLANLAKTKIAQDPVPEPIVVQSRYLQNAFEQIAEELSLDVPLTGPPQFTPLTGTGWTAGAGISWRTLNGGATVEMCGTLTRMGGAIIPPGVANNVTLCVLPVRPLLNTQIAIVPVVAATLAGSPPEEALDYGWILFSTTGAVTLYPHAPITPTSNGTGTVYLSCVFSLTLPNLSTMADELTPLELAAATETPAETPSETPAAAEPPPTLHRDATEENADGSTHVKEDEEIAFDWRGGFSRLLAFFAELWIFLYDCRPWAKVRASIDPAPTAPRTWPTSADDRGPATEIQHGP